MSKQTFNPCPKCGYKPARVSFDNAFSFVTAWAECPKCDYTRVSMAPTAHDAALKLISNWNEDTNDGGNQ